MARGLQKQESQKKNAEAAKKAKGGSHLAGHAKAVKIICPGCKQPMANKNNLIEHFEAKHPALPKPDFDAIEAATKVDAPPMNKKK